MVVCGCICVRERMRERMEGGRGEERRGEKRECVWVYFCVAHPYTVPPPEKLFSLDSYLVEGDVHGLWPLIYLPTEKERKGGRERRERERRD